MTRILAIVLIILIFSCQRGQKRESNGNITTGWPHLNPGGIPDSLILKGAYLVTLRAFTCELERFERLGGR
jgi:hypothetical protein